MSTPSPQHSQHGVTWADLSSRQTGREIATAAGVTLHAIRYYVRRGLLKPPELHGMRSLYAPGAIVRVLAIRKLTALQWSLEDARKHLAGIAPGALADLAGIPRVPPPLPATAPPPLAATQAKTEATDASLSSEPWSRVTLLPGLELHVRADAAPFVRRVALEIATRYRTEPGLLDAAET